MNCFRLNLWIMKNYNVKQSWRIVEHEYDAKLEAVHLLKELKHYIPNKRSLCYNTWFCQSLEFVGAPIYVQSLVSTHVCRRKRKRQAVSNKRSGKVSKGDVSGCRNEKVAE